MINRILVGIISVFLIVIGVELFVLFVINPSSTKKVTEASLNNTYYPVQSGLLNSYIYPFELRNLPITQKLVVSTEYEGFVDMVTFKKGEALVVKLANNDVWISVYKKPHGFQETDCKVYDKTGAGTPYTFDEAPFKKGDKINITQEVDYKNFEVACSIKSVQ